MRRTLFAALVLATSYIHAAVTGSLLDESGKPLAGARIRAWQCDDSATFYQRVRSATAWSQPLVTTESKSDGTFTIDTKGAGRIDILVDTPGRQYVVLESVNGEDVGALSLVPGSMRRGRVTAGGNAASKARIFAGRVLIAETDSEGRYDIPDPLLWTNHLTVVHRDFAIEQRSIANANDLDIDLSAGTTLHGRIVRPDGRPAPHTSISIGDWPLGESADDGSFAIEHVPLTWRALTFARGNETALVTNRHAASYDVHLQFAASASGTVIDVKSEAPVPFAFLSLAADADSAASISVVADAKGQFAFHPLPAASYHGVVSHPAYRNGSFQIAGVNSAAIRRFIAMTPMSRVSGRVIGEGAQPIAGATVKLQPAPVRTSFGIRQVTDRNGEFKVRVGSIRAAERSPTLRFAKTGYANASYGPLVLKSAETRRGVTVVMMKGFPLVVSVVDAGGKQVTGTVVTILHWLDDAGADKEPVCDEGNCRNELLTKGVAQLNLVEGKYEVAVAGRNVIPIRLRERLLTAHSAPLTITVQRGVTLSGRVVNADGSPMTEGAVIVHSGNRAPIPLESNGTFALNDVPPGKIILNAKRSGPPVVTSPMVEVRAPAIGIVLKMPRTGRIEGRVLDKASREPVRAFCINLVRKTNPDGRTSQPISIQSDDGTFAIDDVESGGVTVVAAATGYLRGTIADITVEQDRSAGPIEIQLERGSRVVGRVTAGGRPLADVVVNVNQSVPVAEPAVTDANGEYVVDSVEPGERKVVFRKTEFAQQEKTINIAAAGETRLDVELQLGRDLLGRVVNRLGEPISGASVEARDASGHSRIDSTQTDGDGSFHLAGLDDGQVTLVAMKIGYTTTVMSGVDPASGTSVTLVLGRGATITGRVVGISAEEMGDYHVLTYGSNAPSVESQLDGAGNFTLRGIPDGRNAVYASRYAEPRRQSAIQYFEVKDGAAPPIEIDMSSGITIRGRVTRNGRPVEGGWVSFSPLGGKRNGASNGIGADGRYQIDALQPGDYTVSVNLGGGGFGFPRKYTAASDATLDIDVESVTLRGRVIDAMTGAAVSAARVAIVELSTSRQQQTITDSDGKFQFDDLVDGAYRAIVQKERYTPRAEPIEVKAGTGEVEIRIAAMRSTPMHVSDDAK
jgi:hypothetical protein